jgi:FkbM family methyltransferase
MKNLILKLFSIYEKIFSILKHQLFPHATYRIGNYNIKIPSSAKLPDCQKMFPLYDRFLPVLAKNLSMDGTIIDVGANVGDTLFAMIQWCRNNFICVEPASSFFWYLKDNVQNLSIENKKRVRLVQALVGSGSFSGVLQEQNGTASVVLNTSIINNSYSHYYPPPMRDNILNYNKLDDIVEDSSDIILLKSDVDGWDFDVIKSAQKILSESEPILFFENQIDTDFQCDEFDRFYDFLQEKGYCNLYIFDNFGNIVVEKSDYHTLKGINAYLFSMKKYHTTRTFYYTDILAVTNKRLSIVENAIEDYKSNWIKNKEKIS